MVTCDLDGNPVHPFMAFTTLPHQIKRHTAVIYDPDGCWTWTGATDRHGYPVANMGGRTTPVTRVHRNVYETLRGPITPGLVTAHACADVAHAANPTCRWATCPHKRCINPWHMVTVQPAVNLALGRMARSAGDPAVFCEAAAAYLDRLALQETS